MNFSTFSWPRILSLVILMAGLVSYLRNYPIDTGSGQTKAAIVEDSLMNVLTRLPGDKIPPPNTDTGSFRNPFLNKSSGVSVKGNSVASSVSPVRRWTLKGTAGNSVATLLDSAGVKHLMRVGDTLGGVQVLEVHPSHVSMQDEAGRFELRLDQ